MRKDTLLQTITKEELSARDVIRLTATDDAVKLKDVVNVDDPITIRPKCIFMVKCTYDESDNVDDHNLVIINTEEGNKYISSSEVLIRSINDLKDQLEEMGDNILNDTITIIAKKPKNETNNPFLKAIL